MADTYTGIDYGNGKANIDEKTGIRFGVISARVVDYWYECAELFYPPCKETECVESGDCACEIEPEWFSGSLPYPVYRVSDDSIVSE